MPCERPLLSWRGAEVHAPPAKCGVPVRSFAVRSPPLRRHVSLPHLVSSCALARQRGAGGASLAVSSRGPCRDFSDYLQVVGKSIVTSLASDDTASVVPVPRRRSAGGARLSVPCGFISFHFLSSKCLKKNRVSLTSRGSWLCQLPLTVLAHTELEADL